MFIDKAKIFVQSGHGGNGCVSFRREKFVPRGGPDGGDGGDGGNVYIEASAKLQTLYDFRYKRHFKAKNGQPGMGANRHGKNGEDVIIRVPCGTIITNNQQPMTSDLTEPGQRVLMAQGGCGGRGNTHYKSSTNQAPRYAQEGTTGEEAELQLELKLIADVGIIGMPNAGKSTLLAHLTAAKPKIANYPFTTLSPNLGVLELTDRYITLADIPGLIEGAHEGIGLGDEFLRHIERTKILLHVVDLSAEDPMKNYDIINNELKKYSKTLGRKPQVLVLNKIDMVDTRIKQHQFNGISGHSLISAATGEGLTSLKTHLEKVTR